MKSCLKIKGINLYKLSNKGLKARYRPNQIFNQKLLEENHVETKVDRFVSFFTYFYYREI